MDRLVYIETENGFELKVETMKEPDHMADMAKWLEGLGHKGELRDTREKE